MGHYQPLSWVTLALNYKAAGLSPANYHLTNVALHGLNALLAFWLIRRLLTLAGLEAIAARHRDVAAAFGALLFALHPLRVESVAWATQRRDVLSAAFMLGALLWYLRAAEAERAGDGRRARMALAVTFLLTIVASASKSIGYVMLGLLLVLDVYPLRRLSLDPRRWLRRGERAVLLEKVPYLALAAAGVFLAVDAQRQATALVDSSALGLGARLNTTVRALALSVEHTLVPVGLAPLYELPFEAIELAGGVFRVRFDAGFLWSAAVVTVMTVASLVLLRRLPGFAAAWAVALVFLIPVSGLFQSGPQYTADRYTYLAFLGFATLAAAGLATLLARSPSTRSIALGAGALVVLALGAATFRQVGIWHDSGTLWSAATRRQPHNARAHLMLGTVHYRAADFAAAERDYRRAVELWPTSVPALYLLAVTCLERGDHDEAERWNAEALKQDPQFAMAQRLVARIRAARDAAEEPDPVR
jgi:tetratricopeptide (TPR) repeat protein